MPDLQARAVSAPPLDLIADEPRPPPPRPHAQIAQYERGCTSLRWFVASSGAGGRSRECPAAARLASERRGHLVRFPKLWRGSKQERHPHQGLPAAALSRLEEG